MKTNPIDKQKAANRRHKRRLRESAEVTARATASAEVTARLMQLLANKGLVTAEEIVQVANGQSPKELGYSDCGLV